MTIRPPRRLEPAEIPIWEAIEREVRAELEAEYAEKYREQDERQLQRRDKAMRAIAVLLLLAVSIGMPLFALLAGASWRLMLWAAGCRPLF